MSAPFHCRDRISSIEDPKSLQKDRCIHYYIKVFCYPLQYSPVYAQFVYEQIYIFIFTAPIYIIMYCIVFKYLYTHSGVTSVGLGGLKTPNEVEAHLK